MLLKLRPEPGAEKNKYMIPFVDLRANYANLKGALEGAISDVCDSASLILGAPVEQFENRFASYVGSKFAVGMGTGTDALFLACRALEIGPGDEVLVPANTFIASALAVNMVGAIPVPVDIDADSYLMDIAAAGRSVSKRTKAIMPVHLYGQVMDMDVVSDFATAHGLKIIEDAAQAHGAKFKGRSAGAIGDIGCFSFYPSKNLGALGDGGLAVTSDEALAEKLRLLRNYGSTKKYFHELAGTNSRLDAIQAAVLNVKLDHLDGWNRARFAAASRYCEGLEGVGSVTVPKFERSDIERHIFHLFVILAKDRDGLSEHLNGRQIRSGVHYPIPFHLQQAFEHIGFGPSSCPVAESQASQILSLPMFPEISNRQIDNVVRAISEYYG